MIRRDQLRLIRVAILGNTVKEVAEDLGVSRMRVMRYENGEQKAPHDYLNDFARVYGFGWDTIDKLRNFEKALAEVQRARVER